ncbi:VWA domain-containing protein [Rossellomorea vietnamensis]|uniref:vWA domain-containing protein n=1 Tax=Rossellomorea vietnamensis TaxID=218284 RepID=UPI003D29DE38
MNCEKSQKILPVLILFIISLSANTSSANVQQIDTSYMIVIDASGSMSANDRMERAKNSAEQFLDSIKGKNIEIGLIAFYGCDDIRVLQGLTNDVDEIRQPLRNIQPSGSTPLAASITYGGNYLKENGIGDKGKLLVYTDGEDSCGGDYQESKAAISGLEFDIWGIDLPQGIKDDLEEQLGLNNSVKDLPIDQVTPVLKRIFIDDSSLKLIVGEALPLNLNAEWMDGSITTIDVAQATITSSREDRLLIHPNGVLEGVSIGTSFLDVNYNGNAIRTVITVEQGPIITDFYSDTPIPSKMTIGDKYTITGLKAKWSNGDIKDLSINDVKITSSYGTRVTVNGNGEVEALASGTSYVDIVYQGKKIRTLVTVDTGPTVTDFYSDTPIPSKMTIGDKYTITGLKAKWSNGVITDVPIDKVRVNSSRVDRLTIDSTGNLEAINVGTSYVDIIYNDSQLRVLVTVSN